MKYIVGKKMEMSRIWRGDVVVPITKVQVGPCRVVQVKTESNDGYDAVQIGYFDRKPKNIAKPQLRHMQGLGNFRWLREFRYNLVGKNNPDQVEFDSLNRGDWINASTFEVGDIIQVVGYSKGRGFQGGVKRHGFHGHNTTHGTKDQVRMPGSIGAGEPQHVFKGTRMAGRMGDERVTVTGLEIVEVNPVENTISIKGGLPGAKNGLLLISGKGALVVAKEPVQPPVAEATENEPVVEEVVQVTEEAKVEMPIAEEVKAEALKVEPSVAEAVEVKEVKTEEAKTEVPKAEKAEVEVEAVKAEEVKSETLAAEAKAEPTLTAVTEAKKEESYADKYAHLPKAERDKLASAEVMAAVVALEDTYKMDLVSVMAKLAIKELTEENLAAYMIEQYKFDQNKAEQIANELKERVLHLVK